MPRKTSKRKSSRRKSTRKTSRRPRKSSRRKSSRKSLRKPRKTSTRRPRKTSKRKTTRKSPKRKSSYTSSGQKNEYVFSVWYVNKPKVNKKFTVKNAEVKLDDDNEWLFTGFIQAESKETAKAWLRSLGSVKRYSGSNEERLEI